MAKSQRASSRKRNNAALRSKVFDPATNARTARLSAKLQELASKPKAEEEKAMDVDRPEDAKVEEPASAEDVEEGERCLWYESCNPLMYAKIWMSMLNPQSREPAKRPHRNSPVACRSTASPSQRKQGTMSSSPISKPANSDRRNEKRAADVEKCNMDLPHGTRRYETMNSIFTR